MRFLGGLLETSCAWQKGRREIAPIGPSLQAVQLRRITMKPTLLRCIAGVWLAAFMVSIYASAQEFKVFDRTVQFHGYGSQGFAYSNNNNFLTMNTSNGSPALTEGAINISASITDNFRVGAQGFARKIGSLDDGRPQLDWALGDFKFARWFGVRAGKVKTAMGLYNDTQDMDFLHLWALLPQGVYPADLRSTYIAHTGGDVYGRIPLKKLGKLDYTAYAGTRSFDNRGGLFLFTTDNGFNIETINGHMTGWDLKWATPAKGLMLGSSWANMTMLRYGQWISVPFVGIKYTNEETPEMLWVGYGSYTRDKWEFDAEYRSLNDSVIIGVPSFDISFPDNQSTEAWFASAAYRVNSKLQVGYYHSNFHVDNPLVPTDPNSNHIYDEVGTARYDFNRNWDLKVEGHFMNGYGDAYNAQGFYTRWNPKGFKPTTDMLVLRTSFNF
jgi:hypothetical protein